MADEQLFHLGVKALITNSRNEILILQKNISALKFPDIAYWDMPGGRIRKEGTIEKTLMQEIEEETGLKNKDIKVADMFDISLAHNKIPADIVGVSLVLIVFRCKIKGNRKIRLRKDEHIKYKWASVKEAKKLLAYKFPKSFIKKLDLL